MHVGQVNRIDALSDDVLLDIFDFYLSWYYLVQDKRCVEAWQLLIHVCRRWRSVVFRSPRRLDLRLCSTTLLRTSQTPARDALDDWPDLPVIVQGLFYGLWDRNVRVISALLRTNRVSEVDIRVGSRDSESEQWEEVLTAMEMPFPNLRRLKLGLFRVPKVISSSVPIPDTFLGGSAPRLRYLELEYISFPRIPKLLLSATHLVYLHLRHIPHSGYISPEAVATCLSVLTSLNTLSLEFESPLSRPDWESRSLSPPKRYILTALHGLEFSGVTEYLEDLVTRIDAPQLNLMWITFFNQIDFDCPRLAQFINCTPALRALDEAHVRLSDSFTSVTLGRYKPTFNISVSCLEPDWQLSFVEQVCNSSLPPFSTVEDLYIEHHIYQEIWKNDAIENALWLRLLLPFTAVKNLYLDKEIAPDIAAALQELVGGRIAEVLPSLENIFVRQYKRSGPFHKNIRQFVAARQLSGHTIAISLWRMS